MQKFLEKKNFEKIFPRNFKISFLLTKTCKFKIFFFRPPKKIFSFHFSSPKLGFYSRKLEARSKNIKIFEIPLK